MVNDTNNVSMTLTADMVRAARDSLTELGKEIHLTDEDIQNMSIQEMKSTLAKLTHLLRSLPRNT